MQSRVEAVMSTTLREQYFPYVLWGILGACLIAGSVAALADPLLPLVALPCAAAVLCLVAWPKVATLVTMFVLYMNVAAVAVKFHGVPYFVGAMAILPLAMPALHYIVVRREEIILTKNLILVLAFFAIQFVGALFSTHPDHAFKEVIISLLEGVLLYLAITNAVRTEATLRQVVWVLLAAGALMGSLSAYQQLTGTFDNNYGGFAQIADGPGFGTDQEKGAIRQQRLAGPVGQQNRYAQIMLMLLPLALFRWWGERSTWLKAAGLAATALIAVGWTLAFSRGSAVGLALVVLVMTVLGYVGARRLAGLAIGAAVLLAVFPQYWSRLVTVPDALDALRGTMRAAALPDGAIRGRATEMTAAVRVWAEHPLLGVGPGVFELYSREYAGMGTALRALEGNRRAHSLYLELAAEHGLIGLGCFLAMVGLTLRNLARVRRQTLYVRPDTACLATGFLLAIVAYLATGLFAHFSYVRYFWMMLALADAASLVALQRRVTNASADAATEGATARESMNTKSQDLK
jgi:putative inorganic carbon (HCO3(-)) transporter